jgi:uncharacterized damage-inducible protein DinB
MSHPNRRTILRASALAMFGACVPPGWGHQFPRVPRQEERPVPGRNFAAELINEFKVSHVYTMECAQSMPEKSYDFRPTPEERSFGQQMVHIAEALDALYQMLIADKPAPMQPFSEAGQEPVKSKLDVLNKLEAAFNQVEKGVAGLSDSALDKRVELLGAPATKLRVLHFLLDHTAHHRGEVVVYMRLKGVKPPVFRA